MRQSPTTDQPQGNLAGDAAPAGQIRSAFDPTLRSEGTLRRLTCLMPLAASLAAAALFAPDRALAWGDEGHQVVVLIAEHYLEPSVRHKVFALLAADPGTLTAHDIASQSLWADRFRDSDRFGAKIHYEQTRRWHFVDIDLHAKDIDAACNHHPPLPASALASAGPGADCAIDKIDQFTAELASPATLPDERLLALKFLLHLVGDLHQPLHAVDDHDSGGNAKNVKTRTRPKASLHHYWDVEFLRKLGTDPTAVAGLLIGRIDAQERQAWSAGSATDWAMESFGVASELAYGKLPKPRQGVYLLSPAYEAKAVDAVALQLEKGGVRLADVLNRALGD
jgi:S1/P1 Nuclease